MNDRCYGWGHHRHTHTAAETIPSDMISSGLGTRPGTGTEGWGEKCRHLDRVLAASSLFKVVLKTLKYINFSCTLLNGAAFFISSLKTLKFFLPCSMCPCPSLLAGAILTPAFFPLVNPLQTWHCKPGPDHSSFPQGIALRNWPLLRKSSGFRSWEIPWNRTAP